MWISHIKVEEEFLLPYVKYLNTVIENGFDSKVYFSRKQTTL
jgi:hypothetical protein